MRLRVDMRPLWCLAFVVTGGLALHGYGSEEPSLTDDAILTPAYDLLPN